MHWTLQVGGSWKSEERRIAQLIGQTWCEKKTRSRSASGFIKEGESDRTCLRLSEKGDNTTLWYLSTHNLLKITKGEYLAKCSHSKFFAITQKCPGPLKCFPSLFIPGTLPFILSDSLAFWNLCEPHYSPLCLAVPSSVLCGCQCNVCLNESPDELWGP